MEHSIPEHSLFNRSTRNNQQREQATCHPVISHSGDAGPSYNVTEWTHVYTDGSLDVVRWRQWNIHLLSKQAHCLTLHTHCQAELNAFIEAPD